MSWYAFFVEHKREEDELYKAACDFNDRVSCTKAFSSRYAKIFGFSNSLGGIVFYTVMCILNYFNFYSIIFYMSIFSLIVSAYLAYGLVKLRIWCVVCSAIYLINLVLFFVTFRI